MNRRAGPEAVAGALLLRDRDAAALLGIGRTHFRELALRRGLPSVKLGKARRWARSDLERLVEDLRAGGDANGRATK
jgi:excisionase family DNA binding protein